MSVQVEGYRGETFEALEAAVMETPRGRWFLEEFAKRQRSKETLAILASLHKLEKALLNGSANSVQLQKPLAQTRESLKFFKEDEDLFEPAPIVPKPAVTTAAVTELHPKAAPENKGARLRIHHAPTTADTVTASSELPPAPIMVAETESFATDAEAPLPASAGPGAKTPSDSFYADAAPAPVEEEQKQRVVIIRKQLEEEEVEIPMMDETTPANITGTAS